MLDGDLWLAFYLLNLTNHTLVKCYAFTVIMCVPEKWPLLRLWHLISMVTYTTHTTQECCYKLFSLHTDDDDGPDGPDDRIPPYVIIVIIVIIVIVVVVIIVIIIVVSICLCKGGNKICSQSKCIAIMHVYTNTCIYIVHVLHVYTLYMYVSYFQVWLFIAHYMYVDLHVQWCMDIHQKTFVVKICNSHSPHNAIIIANYVYVQDHWLLVSAMHYHMLDFFVALVVCTFPPFLNIMVAFASW